MSSNETAGKYRFISDVGKFNAEALLAAKAAGKKLDDDEVLKEVAGRAYAKFHVKGGLYEDSTEGRALKRLKLDLQRLKDNHYVIPAIAAYGAGTAPKNGGKVQKRSGSKSGAVSGKSRGASTSGKHSTKSTDGSSSTGSGGESASAPGEGVSPSAGDSSAGSSGVSGGNGPMAGGSSSGSSGTPSV